VCTSFDNSRVCAFGSLRSSSSSSSRVLLLLKADVCTRRGPIPAELPVGTDARYALTVLRWLPPAVAEFFIWKWMSWGVTKPLACGRA
jgi:hypothetical protein